ncbi:MAG: glycosyltransferase [Dehalococcoidia bacterium]
MEAISDVMRPRGVTTDQSYGSVDSAPLGFAVSRAPWLGVLFLLTFSLLISAIIFAEPWVKALYVTVLEFLARSATTPQAGSLGVRPIFIAFILTFWAFANGTWQQRLRLLLLMGPSVLVIILQSDALLLLFGEARGFGPFSLVGHIVSGYVGLLMVMVSVMVSVRLPAGIKTETIIRRPRYYMLVILGSIALTVALILWIVESGSQYIELLRDFAVLGGIGPGVVLFYPIIVTLLAIIGTFIRIRKFRYRRSTDYSVGIIIPAYNEAEGIAECIHSLDDAAANYTGPCRIYVVDNGSTDDTVAVARRAVAQCRALRGEVLIAPQKGKAAALNFGISQITEDVILRVDADTFSTPSLLVQLMPYFSDANVGIVGGLPLPKDSEGFYSRMRAIEVYYNIGYSRIAQSAVDSLLCVPGIQTAYRREALLQAGDFSEGVNGEDTDMTVRIGRLGYRVIVDPKIHVYSEVPDSWAHLREQRIRWSRSILHVFARNMSSMWMMQGVRGLWLVPNSLWSVFRRVLTVLILVYGGLVAMIDPSVLSLREGAALGAILFGPSGFLTLLTLIVYRKFNLLPYLPGYLGFRMLRAYLSLDMLFTLSLKPIEYRRKVIVSAPEEESVVEGNLGIKSPKPAAPVAGVLRAISGIRRPSLNWRVMLGR